MRAARRAVVVLAWVCCAAGCEPEPQLAVAEASLLDNVAVFVPPGQSRDPPPPVVEPTEAELRLRARVAEITPDNALERARALEQTLVAEIQSLETRLTPVEVELGE